MAGAENRISKIKNSNLEIGNWKLEIKVRRCYRNFGHRFPRLDPAGETRGPMMTRRRKLEARLDLFAILDARKIFNSIRTG